MSSNIFMESDSDDFIFPKDPHLEQFDQEQLFDQKNYHDIKILPAQCSTIAESVLNKDKDSNSQISYSKKILNSAQGKLARERKKKYLSTLETQVQELELQVKKYEEEILKTKETLAQTLNSTKNNQNSITYGQLQLSIESEDPNEDKINLLLDMIKFRIGASGHERQAKIEYFFKQLVNTLFPAIHRYLMYSSDQNLDLFQEQSIEEYFGGDQSKENGKKYLSWTADFLQSLEMTESQKQNLLKLTPKYIDKKLQVKHIIKSLKQVKQSIQSEERIFQNMIDELRSGLRPVQAAAWVLFSDKSKYKREITLQREETFDFLAENDQIKSLPAKKVKLE